jgi:transposase
VENDSPPDIQQLLKRLSELEKMCSRLEAENTHLKAELARKNKTIAGLQQRLFGSSSEKLDPNQLQFKLDELLLGKSAPPVDPDNEESATQKAKSKPAVTRRTKADRFPKNLKILVDGVIIPAEVLANPADWQEIGEENHDELDVTKGEIFWRRIIRKKFVSKIDKAQAPVIAPAPLPSIPGTLLAPALAAQIITDKYQDHLPHYRQSQRFRRRHGADIGRQTLNAWTHATARHLAPINRAIKAELLQASALEIDETPIDYQDPGHGSVREGRLWAYRDPVAGTCYFDWHAGRGTVCLLKMLGYDEVTNTIAYEGAIHTDGYAVYDAVASKFGLSHGGCLAHARRKFTDLGPASPEVTLPVLHFIQRIYLIENQTRQTQAPPACRELIRRARSLPVADELNHFILEQYKIQRPASNVAQALGYTLNQWEKIRHCLSQGVLEIDTNLVENMIRPTKLGMKNWMFFGSLEAGTNNALIYTLLANCRAHDLDPEDYLIEVIKRLPAGVSPEQVATPEQAAALTPARIAAERRAKLEIAEVV